MREIGLADKLRDCIVAEQWDAATAQGLMHEAANELDRVAEPTDGDVLKAASTFENGCDFTLHFTADGRVLLSYGCYGVHWNLVQGARYRLSRWLGINGEAKEIHLHPDTLRTLKERKPCRRCGGFTFERTS